MFELVDQGVAFPLLVVSAPAGTGKTALLAGWAAEAGAPTAWLSLEADDSGSGALVADLSAALTEWTPDSTPRDGAPPSTGPSDALVALLDRLGRRPGPASVLVLDNVQRADSSPELAASLGLLIGHAPEWLHVVLLSRHAAPVPLDRLRATGRLGEVRADDLMFTEAEAAQLLGQLAPTLSPTETSALTDLACGWVAGLQLAAGAVRGGQAAAGGGATRAEYDAVVRSYVLHDVLGAEPPEVIDVLYELAVVEAGDAQLARTLTGRPDAPDLLAETRASGLVKVGAPDEDFFAVHPFIRRVLLDEMTAHSPEQVAARHAVAARALEAARDPATALQQWLLADEPAEALRLLAEAAADLYDSGHQATVLATIAVIPAEIAAGDLPAMLDYAWCHLLVSRRRFLELVDQLDWWAHHRRVDPALRPRLTMLRSFAAALYGDWSESAVLARAAMDELGPDAWRDRLGRFGWNVVAREYAMTERWSEGSEAEREAVLGVSRDPHRRIALEATRALGQALAGDELRALRTAADVRQAAPVDEMAVLRAELMTAEGIAHREVGDRAQARAELEEVARSVPEPMTHCAILSLLELTELRLTEQNVEQAATTFDWARVAGRDAAPIRVSRLARTGTAVELAKGDLEAAAAWAGQVHDPFWGPTALARVRLARGDRSAALEAVRSATPRCPRHRVVRNLMQARLARSAGEALEFVTRAVSEAAVHGMRQTVASEGAEILALVERAAWAAPTDWLDGVRRLAMVAGGPLGHEPVLQVEALSPRERDVLRTLPSRLTTREIAAELGISVNTLKYHIKAIYRKLGVSSRAEAAEVARQVASSAGSPGRRSGGFRPLGGSRGPARA